MLTWKTVRAGNTRISAGSGPDELIIADPMSNNPELKIENLDPASLLLTHRLLKLPATAIAQQEGVSQAHAGGAGALLWSKCQHSVSTVETSVRQDENCSKSHRQSPRLYASSAPMLSSRLHLIDNASN